MIRKVLRVSFLCKWFYIFPRFLCLLPKFVVFTFTDPRRVTRGEYCTILRNKHRATLKGMHMRSWRRLVVRREWRDSAVRCVQKEETTVYVGISISSTGKIVPQKSDCSARTTPPPPGAGDVLQTHKSNRCGLNDFHLISSIMSVQISKVGWGSREF